MIKYREDVIEDKYARLNELVTTKYAAPDIFRGRKEISELLKLKSYNLRNETISSITKQDLDLLYELYDEVFFKNLISNSFEGRFRFSLSKRMTKSAGMTICPKNIVMMDARDVVIEIRIGVEFFIHYNQLDGNKLVGGCNTSSAVEALQLVFEHELCHAIEFILFHESSCSKKRFKTMANNIFNHTESCHTLPTNKKIAQQNLGLMIGDKVCFQFEDRKLEGILYNINKRATVMVRDHNGMLVDKSGNKYTKYYVPIKLLHS